MKPRSNWDKLVFAAFLVLVASLSIQKPAVTAIFNIPVAVTDVIFPVVFLLLVASLAIARRLPKLNAAYLFFGIYIAAFFVSSLFAPNLKPAFAKTFATVYLVGLAVLSIELIDSQKRLEYAIFAWLAGSILPVLVGTAALFLFYLIPENSLLPFLTYHNGAVPIGNFPRLSSTFVSASMFCNYLTATGMLLLAARQYHRVSNLIWWTLFILLVLCTVFTVSAGLGAFVLALAIWFHLVSETEIGKVVRVAGISIFVASILATIVALQPHATAPYSYIVPIVNLEIFPSSRIMVWTDAIKTFTNHFVFGSGPGSASANVLFQNTSGQFSLLTDAHNSFLSIAAQTGIIGLTAFVAMILYLLRVGLRKRPILSVRYALIAAFISAFVLQGLTGSFEDARQMWILIGMMVAAEAIDGLEGVNSTAKI